MATTWYAATPGEVLVDDQSRPTSGLTLDLFVDKQFTSPATGLVNQNGDSIGGTPTAGPMGRVRFGDPTGATRTFYSPVAYKSVAGVITPDPSKGFFEWRPDLGPALRNEGDSRSAQNAAHIAAADPHGSLAAAKAYADTAIAAALASAAPPSLHTPSMFGWITYMFAPAMAQGGSVPASAGTAIRLRLRVLQATTCSGFGVQLTSAGTGLSNCFGALRKLSDRSLLAQSTDASTQWMSAALGWKITGWAGGTILNLAAADYDLDLWWGAGTGPQFARANNTVGINGGLTGNNAWWKTGDTGLGATAPATGAAGVAASVAFNACLVP